MKNDIGFKAALKRNKGACLRFRLHELYWQLRYAWQRAWKGYDNTDVFNLGFNFAERMPILLREFRKNNVGLFPDLDNPDRIALTEEETNAVIEEMIFYFENCDHDHVYKRLFGVYPCDEDFNHTKYRAAMEESNRCWREAMRLFAKWSMSLWY